ncbi:MAG: helix-turn-helix transcriptional regulator [Mogibacterium sp.]|nr:helix-turn-helix transcriptional regulator [Mogibacterium sp.]
MDQIKIGNYISEKRKAAGLTQEQLAEKLGKSGKSVSKWERGVCLPDVSVYTELCDILGITLNEFFAGEDIKPIDVPARSEKNLLGVATEGENRSGRFKKIAIAITAVALGLAAALGFVMIKEGYFLSNYLKSLDYNTKEGKMAVMLSDGYPAIYQFHVDKKYTYAEVSIHKYVDGVERKISGGDLRHFIEGEKHEGTVALIPNTLSSNELKLILATNESRIETGMDIESELPEYYEDYSTSFTWQSKGIIKAKTNEEIPLGILYVSNDESDIFPGVAESSESIEDTIRGIKDAGIDYAFLFTVRFGID